MPTKRTRKLEVFADRAAPTRSLRNKRKHSDADAIAATAETGSHAPTPKRPALGAKTANSRDTSRREEADISTQAKVDLKAIKHGSLESQPFLVPQLASPSPPLSSVSQRNKSPTPALRAALKHGSDIRRHLEDHSSDIDQLNSLIANGKIQEVSDYVSLKGCIPSRMTSRKS